MNVLITGGRSPYTLELIRMFGKAGHRVIAVEFFSFYLSEYSKYVSCSYVITAPNDDLSIFKEELLEIIRKEQVDLVIPTCEEVFHLAKIREDIGLIAKPFFASFNDLEKLHSKFDFINMVKSRNLLVPKTFILSEYNRELSGKKVILKKTFSRFASNIHIVFESEVDSLKLKSPGEWVIQEFIMGNEASVYAVVCEGQICAYSCYFKKYSVNGGATVLFQHSDSPQVASWLKSFFMGTSYTGHFSFDLMLDESLNVYPLECNPRATSGIHLFNSDTGFTQAFLGQNIFRTPPNHSKSMLGLAMLIYGFSLKNIREWLKDFRDAKDVIFSLDDMKPFFTQFITFGYFIFLALLKKKKVVEVTTLDIEYNG